jgi:hypothetical protein
VEDLRDAAVEALQSAARQSDPREFDRLTRLALRLIEWARALRRGSRHAISRPEGTPVSGDSRPKSKKE